MSAQEKSLTAFDRSLRAALLIALSSACGAPKTVSHAPTAQREPPKQSTGPKAPELASTQLIGLEDALARGITEDALRSDVEALASDALLGRAPGTEGETRTLAYLTHAFEALRLAPGGDKGTYLSRVPLLGAMSRAEARFDLEKTALSAKSPDDFVAQSRTGKPEVTLAETPLLFVGYGVIAPELGWDDFKGVDVRGKLLIMLVGDPPVPDPHAPGELDPSVFGGRAMTYYGRWTYKYEIASQKGAAGVLLVHETGPAGYGYDVVQSGAAKEQLMLDDPHAPPPVAIEGWLSEPFARRLFSAAQQDFDMLKARAVRRDFAPVSLEATADLRVHSALRHFDSHNVIGVLPGTSADEAVVVTAHWDHFGHDEHAEGDGIFNGAIDNASGVASMLAVARALTALPKPLRRSVVFLAPTAEESGLLGAKAYANAPYVPLARTLANVNMDCMNLWGRAHAIVSVGLGTSDLDELLSAEATRAGRVVIGDPEPEKGYFFRSDHLELMRKGVPALHFLHPGAQYEGRTEQESAALRANYVSSAYHKVTDQASSSLRYDGAVDDARLLTRVIVDITEGDTPPTWKPGSAFAR